MFERNGEAGWGITSSTEGQGSELPWASQKQSNYKRD